MTTPEIRTARLRLRGWRAEDRIPYAALNADPAVMEHFPAPLSRQQSDAHVDRMVERWRVDELSQWAVELLDGESFIGFTGLSRPDFAAHFMPCVEVGWRLARWAWGHGYATEAATAALAYGFEEVGLAEIVSFTSETNLRSRAVMERLGLSHDPADDFDHPRVQEGDPLRRHVLYRLSVERWRALPVTRTRSRSSSDDE